MATWGEFAEREPETASLGYRILTNYGLAYLGTIRSDGGPRITPVSPIILDGRMFLGLMPHSPKRKDLVRDPHCVVHTLPGPNDSELNLRGSVRQISAEEVDRLIGLAPGHIRIARDTEMYEFDIERVNCTVFEDPRDGRRPSPTRTRWMAEAGERGGV